jgi:hypothetical protein
LASDPPASSDEPLKLYDIPRVLLVEGSSENSHRSPARFDGRPVSSGVETACEAAHTTTTGPELTSEPQCPVETVG